MVEEEGGTLAAAAASMEGESAPTLGSSPSEPTKRLVITKIVMENFKSYAGEVTVGIFHKFFSAIVGPNGSGKSNVIDAILFVFGRKAKSLRQKKVSDLIHNSETYRNLASCRVSVYFQDIIDSPEDPEEFQVVEGSEFVVSRTANRSNASSYYYNGTLSSYTQVTELLMKRGIDLVHNRFLILQGEVEQIAMMPPKGQTEHEEGMLEYLEDIIGSDTYKEPIAEKAQEVDLVVEERTAKLNRVKATDKEMAVLKGPMTEALEYIKLSNDLTKTRSQLYQLNLFECKEQHDKAKEVLEAGQQKLKEHHKLIKEKQKHTKDIDKRVKAEGKECDVLKQAVEVARSNFGAFERKDIKLREDLKHNVTKAKNAQKALATAEKALKTSEKSTATADVDIAAHKKTIASLEKSLDVEQKKLDVVVESLKDETKEVQEELGAKQKDLEPWSKELNVAVANVTMKKQELELIEDQHRENKEQLQAAEKLIAESASIQKKQKDAMASLTATIDTSTRALAKDESRLVDAKSKKEALHSEVKKARGALEEAKASANTSKSQSAVYEALMKQKQTKRIAGIHGRLGDLGTISEKYDVAITTACGALNNFVVETPEAGQRCVEFLRKNNLGRATFLILSEVERLRTKAGDKVDTPDKIPRLFDLVKPNDKKYDTAFYYALKDTLVAPSLDTATQVAYGQKRRWRVVTLEGQLIDTSGTMSGGGTKVARGGMSNRPSNAVGQETLNKLEAQYGAAVSKAAAIDKTIEQLHEAVARLKIALKTAKVDLAKAEMEHASQLDVVQDTKAALPGLKAKAVMGPGVQAKIDQLKQDIAKLERERTRAEAGAAPIAKAIADLQQKLVSIGGVRLATQKAKVDTVKQQIEHEEKGIAKVNVAVKTASKNASKLTTKIAKLEKDVATSNGLVADIKAELVVLESSATEVVKAFKSTEQLLADKEQAMQQLRDSFQAVNDELHTAKAAEVDMSNKVEEASRQVKESSSSIHAWTKKLDKLELQEVPVIDSDDQSDKAKGAKDTEGGGAAAGMQELERLGEEALRDLDYGDLEYDMTIMEEKLSKLRPNLTAVADYQTKNADFMEKVRELEEITERRDRLRSEHDELRKKRLEVFMEGFSIIGMKLKEMYQMITLGGDAELELLDSLDPFSEGIQFSVRPPKKSWKNISNLSGGEKTLSSLALVFALHHYQPTPLYVMDEIDAALDFKNVSIVANYIKERTKNAQFIIISLRNNMFELANLLVGIYKTDNCTKSVTINPNKISSLQIEQESNMDPTIEPETGVALTA